MKALISELLTIAALAAQNEANKRVQAANAQVDEICRAHNLHFEDMQLLPPSAKTDAMKLLDGAMKVYVANKEVQEMLDQLRAG